MVLTRCIFYKQDTTWPKATHLAVTHSDFELPDDEEKELSIWRGMPVAEPPRWHVEQYEVLGWSEGRNVDGRRRRRKIDGLQFHFLV